MRSVAVIVIALALVGQFALARFANLQEWDQFKCNHGKVYATAEEDSRRFSLFLKAKDEIQKHNAISTDHKLGLNHLSDWSKEELSTSIGSGHEHEPANINGDKAMAFLQKLVDKSRPIPAGVDWRKHGRVTSVKDQENCTSGWAFSTVGALEGQQMARSSNNQTSSLSAQNLLDCSRRNTGCVGGYVRFALQDIQVEGGIESDEDYPYLGKQGECQFIKSKSFMSNEGVLEYKNMSETDLRSLVANFGPVSVSLATQGWQHYKSGVFNDASCSFIDHPVLLVGYGTDPQQGDYWIVVSIDWFIVSRLQSFYHE